MKIIRQEARVELCVACEFIGTKHHREVETDEYMK
jgi:hypothetical protein